MSFFFNMGREHEVNVTVIPHFAGFVLADNDQQNKELLMITVDEMMTADIRTLSPRDTLADVQAMMARYNCHHVPITVNKAQLVGLVSQRDVLRIAESRLSADEIGRASCRERV